MRTRTPLLVLLFFSVAACGTDGGVDSIYGSFNGPTLLDGTWIQQRMLCDGTDVSLSPGESLSMTLAGKQLSLSNSFDLGGGKSCVVRTAGQVRYEEAKDTVTFTFGSSACSAECDQVMCVAIQGQTPPPMTFTYLINDPKLTLNTTQGSTLGCTNGKPMVADFQRQ
jgi:hypothetical protein